MVEYKIKQNVKYQIPTTTNSVPVGFQRHELSKNEIESIYKIGKKIYHSRVNKRLCSACFFQVLGYNNSQ